MQRVRPVEQRRDLQGGRLRISERPEIGRRHLAVSGLTGLPDAPGKRAVLRRGQRHILRAERAAQ